MAHMKGSEKAAILLLYLGTEAMTKVFDLLQEEEIKKISQAMARLGRVPIESIETVVGEYTELINPETGFFAQGQDFVREMLVKTLGEQKAEVILAEMQTSSYSDMVDIMANVDTKTIANFLSQEHPQTVAVILAKLKSKQSSDIIGNLPEHMQAEVIMRIADVDQVSPEMIAEIDEVIRKELAASSNVQRFRVGGVEKVVDVFNNFDRSREKKVLENLDTLNPPLAEIIRKHLFTFEDIFKLDDRSIQMIMRELSNDDLTLAMKTSKDDVKDKIFKNISARAAEMIKEDLEVMGPVKLSDVEKAQSNIVKIVRRLEEEGKIVIVGHSGDDVLV